MAWDKMVPFNKKTGYHCRLDVKRYSAWEEKYEYKHVSTFTTTLQITRIRTLWDRKTDTIYYMMTGDQIDMIKNATIVHGEVDGTWKFRKHGNQYGLQYVGGSS